MDVEESAEHRQLRELVEDFTKKEIAPHAPKWDEAQEFPAAAFRRMGELGLLGVMIPSEYGGSGMDPYAATIVMEELARSCAATSLSYGAHAVLCVANLHRNASEEQRKKFLPRLCDGSTMGAMAMSEPGAGSDSLGMRLRAERKGDQYVLNGTKLWITNAQVAGVFLVYAKTKEGRGRDALSAFVVEKGTPGFSIGKKLDKMGMRASPTGELIFEDCRIPVAHRLLEEGSGVQQMMRNLDVERITLSGISLGIQRACLEVAARYASERKQFEKPIGEFQMVQKMLADMATELEAARQLVYFAARKVQQHAEGMGSLAAKAKLFASECATRAGLWAIQILGGYGYTKEFPVERYMRDAKLMEIGAGTSEIQRMIIARDLLKQI
ncbi:MAG: acyl-CoA dehydrogenase family protein [Bdellovibrionota bacterium]